MADELSLEDLQTKVYKLEEELARQRSEAAPRPGAPNDIQVVQVLDAARERLIKWVQLLLVPFAFVLAFAAFMGIRAMTDVKESVSTITRDMEDTKNRLLNSLKNDIEAFRKELQEAQSIIGGFNVHIVTPRERDLLESVRLLHALRPSGGYRRTIIRRLLPPLCKPIEKCHLRLSRTTY